MADREQLRQLAAEINHVVDGLLEQIAVVLARCEGWADPLSHHREFASRVMAVVGPVLAEKVEALHRSAADANRLGEIARARGNVAQRLRGELAVALQQRDEARVNLAHAVELLDGLVDPNEAARRFVEAHREVSR